MTALAWRKPRRSYGGGNCVQAAAQPPAVAVRDSKHPDGTVLRFTRDAFTRFTDTLKEQP